MVPLGLRAISSSFVASVVLQARHIPSPCKFKFRLLIFLTRSQSPILSLKGGTRGTSEVREEVRKREYGPDKFFRYIFLG